MITETNIGTTTIENHNFEIDDNGTITIPNDVILSIAEEIRDRIRPARIIEEECAARLAQFKADNIDW